ncbi:P-aminobenzoate N-oxygenase AurF [Amycolatopsis arida]|uniref:p-aminobenzoate N-oxygenase AurF n=1 Tax=Amycolatopsis arida TaxID=587909 RepID=A0A1I5VSI0_9PSEU|nr:diiron oxygenase [Amycolatopsis arida]TDX88008.1 para-aminobenzoate N-oxygenase AurF [Amycolatopsis arida]SFQ10425.1 P-aminobenzoate N-oxygenase AurF [Amycolatopsis arida]
MVKVGDREATARRLLQSSVKHSYDPEVDVDWDAPLVDGKLFIPERTVSIYGTPLWDRLSPEQRMELSRQEMVNTVSVGIWFEVILMQMLLRMAYWRNPTSQHVRYALTEIADECRHSTMFAMLIERVGERPYRIPLPLQGPAHALPLILRGAPMWVATLIGEEIFDAIQREHLQDDDVQPLVRAVMRIHVTEEARHVRYAREDLVRQLAGARWPTREFTRHVVAHGALLLSRLLSRPAQYARAGLPDPRGVTELARSSPHRREVLTEAGGKLVRFLREADLIGGPSVALWHRAGFQV